MLLAGALALAGVAQNSREARRKSRGTQQGQAGAGGTRQDDPWPDRKNPRAFRMTEARVEVHARTSNPAVDLLVEEGEVEKGRCSCGSK